MKRLIPLLMAALLVLAACNQGNEVAGNTSPPLGEPTPSATQGSKTKVTDTGSGGDLEIDNSETTIAMSIQEYFDDSMVEIPMFSYDGQQDAFEEYNWKNPELELINNEIEALLWPLYNDFTEGNIENTYALDILSYPFVEHDLVQVLVSTCVYPSTHPDEYEHLYSFNFDAATNTYLTLDAMLEDYELTQEDMADAFIELYEPSEGETVGIVEATAFYIDRGPAKPVTHFFLEAMLETESDPYKMFFMYTPDNHELEAVDPIRLFDPEVYNLLSLDPPLAYEQADSDPEPTDTDIPTPTETGGEEVEPSNSLGVIFDTTDLVSNSEGWEDSEGLMTYSVDYLASIEFDMSAVEGRIRAMEGEMEVITATDAGGRAGSYPGWYFVYDSGGMRCTDLYIHTDAGDFRVHAAVPVDEYDNYKDDIEARLNTIEIVEAVG